MGSNLIFMKCKQCIYKKAVKFLFMVTILSVVSLLSYAQMSTTLNGFGSFLSSPGYANSGSYTTYNLGGWQPHHPSCNQYNADGTLITTHSGPVYRTSDGVQVGTFLDNSQVHVRQWSNTDPNVIYFLTATNCTKNTLNNGVVTSTELFNIASARSYFGINFDRLYGGFIEGSFVVGEDNAIAIFGIVGTTGHMLIWKLGTGWLPDHVTMPVPSGDFDLFCATPIKDPDDANNLGYVYVSPITGGTPNNHLYYWSIIKITTTGATSKINTSLQGVHHASMCVYQGSNGQFYPGLVDIYGRVFQHDGGSFTIGSNWHGARHVGWIRGTVYALGGNLDNGANAWILSKLSQGGYQVLANGSSQGSQAYPGAYSKGGIANVNYTNPTSQAVQMRKYTVSGDVTPPSVPTGLASSAITQTTFTLSWTASTDNVAVTGYDVYRNGTLFGSTTTATSLSITGLTCNTAYAMTVRAKDAAGNVSALSSALNVTTSACAPCNLPSGWTGADIGGVTGQSSCESGGTYTIVAGGADIWGTSDQFRYTYQTLNGDGTITAKINSIQNTDPWAKSGVMIRESLAANSAHVDCHVTSGNGISFQLRATTGGTTTSTIASGLSAPYWVRVQRTGNSFSAFRSADGTTWTQVGTATTVTMASSVFIGLAATSHLSGTLGTSTVSNVSISTAADTQAPTVPTGLSSSSVTATSFTLNWTASTDNVGVTGYDVFRNGISYGSTTGATSLSITGLTTATTYAMTVRAKDAAGNLSAFSTALNVTTLDNQAPTVPTGLSSSSVTATSFTLNWTASTDNVGVTGYDVYRNGTLYGSTTTATSLAITGLTCNTAYAMTVKAKDAAGNVSASSSTLNVTTSACSCSLPSGWTGADIGGVTGQSSCESGGTYTIVAGGADIWGTSDQFRYTYQTLNGDGTITAKVNSIQNTDPWAKSGVMIRESLAANSAHVDCHVTSGNGISFQLRATTGGTTTSTIASGISAPYWVRVQRIGNSFTAYRSSDGTTWTQVGTATTVTMASSVYIGLAATSHLSGTLGTSTISNVTITTGSGGGTNMLVNPGFESGTTAWTLWGTPTIVTTNQRSGANCNQVGTNWDGDCQAINSGFSVGNSFTYRAWFKYAGSGSGDGNIVYQCFNGSTQISIGSTNVLSSIGTTYTQYTVNFTVPANTTQIRVSFGNNSNQLMYVDDAELINNSVSGRPGAGSGPGIIPTDNTEKGLKVLVSPNPVSSHTRITIASDVEDNFTVSIYDLSGKLVYGRQIRTKNHVINLNALPSKGMYLLRVTNGKDLVAEKKIIQQ